MSIKYPQFPLTTFPESVDNFDSFLDLNQTDLQFVKSYQEALENGNIVEAQQYLGQIPDYARKMITALNINQLREAVLAMENFYTNDLSEYIYDKQLEWEDVLDKFSNKNTFNLNTQYVKNNWVNYTYNGVSNIYICIDDNTPIGTYPTNTTYWRVLTVQGQKGDAGAGANFAFEWNSSDNYIIDTIVVYENQWWIATQANQNKIPYGGSQYWSLVLTANQFAYPMQPSQPTSQSEGELWFQDGINSIMEVL